MLIVSVEASLGVYIILQITLFIFWTQPGTPRTRASIASAALTSAAAIGSLVLSQYEHLHSPRPSSLLGVYFFFSLLLELARIRTLWKVFPSLAITVVFSISEALKLIVLVLESVHKRSLLKLNYKDTPLETTGGIFSRCLFLWLDPLLLRGYRKELSIEDLPTIDEELSDPAGFLAQWKNCRQNS